MISASFIKLTPDAETWDDWNGRDWQVCGEWQVNVCTPDYDFSLTIAPGFTTDGGSIPKFLQDRVSPLGKYLLAFLVHDALYAGEFCTREQADWIFLELLDYMEMNWLYRNSCWTAVRAGGRFVWNNHTPESVASAHELIKFTPYKGFDNKQ